MATETIDFAVIGFGGAGQAHVRRLITIPGVAVRRVFEPKPALLAHGRARYPGIQFTDRLDEALDAPVRAVTVCTPDHAHFEYAAESVRRGLHTLVEKPMFVTRAECQGMAGILEGSKVVFGVHHQWRYVPAFQAARRLVQEGRLGDIVTVRAEYIHDMRTRATRFDDWRIRPDNPQNIVLGGASHAIDILRWVLGDEIAEVAAFAGRRGWKEYPDVDTVGALLRFASGNVGEVIMTITSRGPQRESIALYGTEGQIHNNVFRDGAGRVTFTRHPAWRRPGLGLLKPLLPLMIRDPEFREYPYYAYEHDVASMALLDDFTGSIRDGHPFGIPFHDARRTIDCCLACIDAYRDHRLVALPGEAGLEAGA